MFNRRVAAEKALSNLESSIKEALGVIADLRAENEQLRAENEQLKARAPELASEQIAKRAGEVLRMRR